MPGPVVPIPGLYTPTGAVLITSDTLPSDAAVYSAIAQLLRATGRFDEVLEIDDEEVDQKVKLKGAIALIVRGTRTRHFTQPSTRRKIRQVGFDVIVQTPARKGQTGRHMVGQLSAVTGNLINGRAFTDYCLYDYSAVGNELHEAEPPVYRALLECTFAYSVDEMTGMKEVRDVGSGADAVA